MRTFSWVALVLSLCLLLPAVAFAAPDCRIDCGPISVPEPGSLGLLLASLGGLAIAKFRKKR